MQLLCEDLAQSGLALIPPSVPEYAAMFEEIRRCAPIPEDGRELVFADIEQITGPSEFGSVPRDSQ